MFHEGEILTDESRSGKERPWKKHKTNSLHLSDSFERLGELNKAEKVGNCGSHLKFNVCPEGHEKRLSWANFCRVRLCPMCSWRRSLLNAHQIKLVAHEANKRQPLRWIFLTLTIKNCIGDYLQDTINDLMKSWDRFSKRKAFKNAVIGWFRALEVTRNHFTNEYHPHFHVLLAVQPSYFRNKDKYLKQEDWQRLWKESMQVDYDPVVDIRIVKNKRNKEKEIKILEDKGIELADSAVSEMAKYSTKADDFLVYKKYRQKQKGKEVEMVPDLRAGLDEKKTDEVVFILDSALSRRRLLAFGGLLKTVWSELRAEGKLDDIEDEQADLIHIDEETECKCSVCGSNMLEELYSWLPDLRNYVKKEKE